MKEDWHIFKIDIFMSYSTLYRERKVGHTKQILYILKWAYFHVIWNGGRVILLIGSLFHVVSLRTSSLHSHDFDFYYSMYIYICKDFFLFLLYYWGREWDGWIERRSREFASLIPNLGASAKWEKKKKKKKSVQKGKTRESNHSCPMWRETQWRWIP